MQFLKTFMSTHGPGAAVQVMDTIEYQGKLWLVPEWIDMPDEGTTMPVRIVCLSNLEYVRSRGDHDFLLSRSIPTSVLAGRVPPGEESKYEIVERPPIRFRGGHGVN